MVQCFDAISLVTALKPALKINLENKTTMESIINGHNGSYNHNSSNCSFVVYFRYKQHSLIPLLLSHGAKVTDVDARTGCTALHYILQYPGATSCFLIIFWLRSLSVQIFCYLCVPLFFLVMLKR